MPNENLNTQEPLLRLEKITKIYPGVIALDNVSFSINKGELHVLLGENGAGKSTAIKIMSGVESHDGGTIYWDGNPVSIKNAKDAMDLGIAVIYQELSSIPCLSVYENMFLGNQIHYGNKKWSINWKKQYEEAKKALEFVGCNVDPRTSIESLGMGKRQLVEIAKAVSKNAKLIIMDEPTSSLSRSEIDHLLDIMKTLVQSGISILFITHKLDEAKKVGDFVTVLKDGKKSGFGPMDEVSENEIIKMMVGRELSEMFPTRENRNIADTVLEVKKLNSFGEFKDVSFDVKKGEILGVFGLVGAGRTETMRAVFAADANNGGEIFLEGEKVAFKSPQDAIQHGVVLLTENRKEEGLILIHDVIENATLPTMKNFRRLRSKLLDNKRRRQTTASVTAEMNLRPPNIEKAAMNFSGGNQQKIVIAKWLLSNAKVYIFDEPTRGVDVGAKVEIYNLMNKLVEDGAAIIMVSSEMQEIIGMSDRIITMYEGRLTGEFANDGTLTQESVMKTALGGSNTHGS